MNNVLLHFASLERDLGPNGHNSVPFGQQDAVQIEALKMDRSQAISSSETDPNHYISTSLGSLMLGPAPSVEINC
jgi:hypothetical protein